MTNTEFEAMVPQQNSTNIQRRTWLAFTNDSEKNWNKMWQESRVLGLAS